MRFLLDTHTLIWFSQGSEKLSKRVSEILNNKQNEIFFSVASAWKMQIKVNKGKLHLDLPLPELIATQINTNQLQILPLELSHIWALKDLPNYHRDPFDRILIAQAIAEQLPLLSIDTVFDNYPVSLVC